MGYNIYVGEHMNNKVIIAFLALLFSFSNNSYAINSQSKEYSFYLSCLFGDEEEVLAKINEGIDVNCALSDIEYLDFAKLFVKTVNRQNTDSDYINTWHRYPLFIATYTGKINIVKLLIEHGAIVNQKNNGWTALNNACERGFLDIAKYLIENGADVNESFYSITPLYKSLYFQYDEISRLLVENGANICSVLNDFNQNIDLACELITMSMNLDVVDYFGRSPLWLADNNIRLVECLLTNGLNPNSKNGSLDQVLLNAIKDGRLDIIKLLVQYGANISVVDYNFNNALTNATYFKQSEIYNYFKEKMIVQNDFSYRKARFENYIVGTLFNIIFKVGSIHKEDSDYETLGYLVESGTPTYNHSIYILSNNRPEYLENDLVNGVLLFCGLRKNILGSEELLFRVVEIEKVYN